MIDLREMHKALVLTGDTAASLTGQLDAYRCVLVLLVADCPMCAFVVSFCFRLPLKDYVDGSTQFILTQTRLQEAGTSLVQHSMDFLNLGLSQRKSLDNVTHYEWIMANAPEVVGFALNCFSCALCASHCQRFLCCEEAWHACRCFSLRPAFSCFLCSFSDSCRI